MALFPKPEENNNDQEIISQLVTRLNDVDRRLRITEQAFSNQKQVINNLNENFVKNRKDSEQDLNTIQEKISDFSKKILEMDAKVNSIREEMKKLPTTAELAELRTRSILDTEIERGSSDLDNAINTLEAHGATLDEELE